ncbi:hypothetical protein SRHO_G00030980 [Serrasalmus rhombeus]
MKKKKIGFGQFCGNRDLRPGYKKPSRAGDRMASHSPKDFFLSFKPRDPETRECRRLGERNGEPDPVWTSRPAFV